MLIKLRFKKSHNKYFRVLITIQWLTILSLVSLYGMSDVDFCVNVNCWNSFNRSTVILFLVRDLVLWWRQENWIMENICFLYTKVVFFFWLMALLMTGRRRARCGYGNTGRRRPRGADGNAGCRGRYACAGTLKRRQGRQRPWWGTKISNCYASASDQLPYITKMNLWFSTHQHSWY